MTARHIRCHRKRTAGGTPKKRSSCHKYQKLLNTVQRFSMAVCYMGTHTHTEEHKAAAAAENEVGMG